MKPSELASNHPVQLPTWLQPARASRKKSNTRRHPQDYQVLCHGWLRGRNHVQAAIHWVSDGRTTSSTISRSLCCMVPGCSRIQKYLPWRLPRSDSLLPLAWDTSALTNTLTLQPLRQLSCPLHCSEVWSSVLYVDAAVGIFPGNVAGPEPVSHAHRHRAEASNTGALCPCWPCCRL